jgi:hypothetical protein
MAARGFVGDGARSAIENSGDEAVESEKWQVKSGKSNDIRILLPLTTFHLALALEIRLAYLLGLPKLRDGVKLEEYS